MCLKALNKNRNHFCIPHQSLSQVGVVSDGAGAWRMEADGGGCAHANHPGDSPPVFMLFQSNNMANPHLALSNLFISVTELIQRLQESILESKDM